MTIFLAVAQRKILRSPV